jgi:uncharacterized heparinase superfamily protein
MNAVEMVRRAAGKPPGYLARRIVRESRMWIRRRWLRRTLPPLTPENAARKVGVSSFSVLWRALTASGFLYTAEEREALRLLYRERYRDEHARLRDRADSILAHRFDLLGSGMTALGDEIDWHRDFKSGRRWPLAPSDKIDYAELDCPSDVKVPWELSRGQHLVTLGQAWVIDRDERAVREFQAQVDSWIRSNPVGFGINWACTMEVALRAVNWVWAFSLVADAPLDPGFVERVLTALYQHALWISENLEIAHINGNHLLSDCLGLVACGALFRGTSHGRRWLESGMRMLEQEIRLQVEADGVDIEGSVAYHRLVLEIFLTGWRLLLAAEKMPSEEYRRRVESMCEYVHAYTTPGGLAPAVGDADDGRVLIFGALPIRDHRYLLSTGAALYGRPAWKSRACRFWDDSLWLLGPAAQRQFEALPSEEDVRSATFPVSGVYVLRTPRQYLYVDAASVGLKGLGGHGHNDCLSFEWHVDGRPVLTDSGLFVYTASPEWRDRFRSTAFHNAIRVDGQEANHFLSPPTLWFLGNDAKPIDVAFRQAAGKEILHAAHTGFRRLPDPVTVSRTFELEADAPVLRIIDRLEGTAEHLVEIFFHFTPGVRFRGVSAEAATAQWDDGFALTLRREQGTPVAFSEREGWLAPSYGVKLPRPVLIATARTRLPVEIVWTLSQTVPGYSVPFSPKGTL